jgi:hypothetical protein
LDQRFWDLDEDYLPTACFLAFFGEIQSASVVRFQPYNEVDLTVHIDLL